MNDTEIAINKYTARLKHYARSESAARLKAMVTLAQSEPGIPVRPTELDQDPWLLNCPNGTLDLRTGACRPHQRQDMITKLAPVPYQPDAKAPRFEKFLGEIFAGKQPLIGYVQRLLGYGCLTGDVSEQILPIFWGTGANGKSTLLNLLLEMLGPDYAIKAAGDLLTDRPGDRHPTETADLFGRRVAVCIETGAGRQLAEDRVKTLTGGDRLRARRMREDFWEFAPTHKVLLCTNHQPTIRGTDHAIWRRIHLIPFTVLIPDDQQDKRLLEKLRGELPGILAWCVRGCRAWQREGLRPPNEVSSATAQYRTEQDVVGEFLTTCCVQGPQHSAAAAELYGAYQLWSEESGEARPISQREFGSALSGRAGLERYASNGSRYRGVVLRPEWLARYSQWKQRKERNHFSGSAETEKSNPISA